MPVGLISVYNLNKLLQLTLSFKHASVKVLKLFSVRLLCCLYICNLETNLKKIETPKVCNVTQFSVRHPFLIKQTRSDNAGLILGQFKSVLHNQCFDFCMVQKSYNKMYLFSNTFRGCISKLNSALKDLVQRPVGKEPFQRTGKQPESMFALSVPW